MKNKKAMTVKEMREWRERIGMKAAELSRAIGRDKMYITIIESRGGNVPAPSVDAIRAVLKGEKLPSEWQHEHDTFDAQRFSDLLRGVNAQKLAADLGKSRTYVYRLANSKAKPDKDTAETLAALLGVSVDYLFGYGGEESKEPVAATPATGSEYVIVKMKVSTLNALRAALESVEGGAMATLTL
jgi:transcriptional regulator with XRE-family HTH domain